VETAAQSRTFGRYRILEKLGVGGMGAVHLAKKEGARELCVLKQLLGEYEEESETARRFKREAHLVSHLDDPHIARILDAGNAEGVFYIAFEFIAGQPLARLLGRLQEKGRWLTPGAAIQIALKVLSGLAYAHARTDPEGNPLNLVHRDLSPANIMIGYDGSVKIIDFGIATSRVDDFRTTPGRFVGTVRYMSPEQALSKPLDHTSDIYTLSAVLWEMLAKKRLIPKLPLQQMIEAIVWKATEPLGTVAPQLSPSLVEVVQRGLQKVASKRWQTAEQMGAALYEAAHGLDLYDQARIGQLMQSEFGAEKAALDQRLDLLLDDVTDELDFRQIAATAVRAPGQGPVEGLDWDEPVEPTKPDAPSPALSNEFEPTRTGISDDILIRSGNVQPRIASWSEPSVRPPTPTLAERPPSGLPIPPRPSRLPMIAAISVVLAAGSLAYVVSTKRGDPSASIPQTPVVLQPEPEVILPEVTTPTPVEIRPRQPEIPTPEAIPADEPSVEDRRPKKEPSKAVRRDPPATKVAEPPAPPPPPPRDRYASLREKVRRLEASPQDNALLLEVHRELTDASKSLPQAKGERIRLDLAAALRSGDVEAFSKVLAEIRAASSN
jgi:eukaryotic-like serine/threonine-protein kinase